MTEWNFLREIGRKLIHLFILLVLISYVNLEKSYGKQMALFAVVILLIFFIILEFFRLDLGWRMPFFSMFIREKEQNRMYGAVFFLAAAIICLAVFDFRIALAALLMATFGDMAAALVGKRYGKRIIFRNKTLIGSSACLLVYIIISLIVLLGSYVLFIPIAMAFTAAIVEMLVEDIDDNLVIPVFSGFVGQLLVFLM